MAPGPVLSLKLESPAQIAMLCAIVPVKTHLLSATRGKLYVALWLQKEPKSLKKCNVTNKYL